MAEFERFHQKVGPVYTGKDQGAGGNKAAASMSVWTMTIGIYLAVMALAYSVYTLFSSWDSSVTVLGGWGMVWLLCQVFCPAFLGSWILALIFDDIRSGRDRGPVERS